MKPQFRKEYEQEFYYYSWSNRSYRNRRFRKASAYTYHHISSLYYRRFQHMSWNREVDFVRHDEECRHYNIKPRIDDSRRIDPWGDYHVNRNYGRSWKDYTRYSKQWMGNTIKYRGAKGIDTSQNGKCICP